MALISDIVHVNQKMQQTKISRAIWLFSLCKPPTNIINDEWQLRSRIHYRELPRDSKQLV